MFKRKMRLVTLVLAMVLILSQVVVLAESAEGLAVEVAGEGVKTELKLTLADLKAMPEEAQISDEYIYNSKSGQKSVSVKGVSLAYVLKEKAGVTAKNAEVIFETSDGYPVDPQTLEDIFNEDLKFVLAYEIDGKATDNIVVYRELKESGEFGTVYKMVVKITVGKPIEIAKEKELKAEEVKDIVFTDITEKYKFAEASIEELAKKGIINGVGNDKYAPEKEFTRAEFCKVMVEALGYDKAQYTSKFTDVKANDWFAPYVQAAVEAGLFKGYTDGSFKPNQTITRQEAAKVVGTGAVIAEVVPQAKLEKFVMEKSKYQDKDLVPNWAEHEVAWLESQGVFTDIAPEKFEPTKVVNRAEAAVIVYNALFK